jgi:hypothetical protein
MPKEEASAIAVDELAILAARPRRIEVYTLDKATDARVAKTLRVAPMTLDICGEVAHALRPIVEAIGVNINLDDVPAIVADHASSARAIVAAATEETPAYIGSLPLDQFLLVTKTVWEVNYDFFVRLVAPTARALGEKMFAGGGPTSSTISQNTGT